MTHLNQFLKIRINRFMLLAVLLFSSFSGHLFAQCSPDITPPVLTPPANMTISLEDYLLANVNLSNYAQLDIMFGTASATDICGGTTINQANSMLNWVSGDPRELTRSFIAFDGAGNSATATQVILIDMQYMVHIPDDFVPGDPYIDSMQITTFYPALVGVSYSDQFFLDICNNELTRKERIWSFLDWGHYDPGTPTVILPSLDIDNDGVTGDSYSISVLLDSVYLMENGLPTIAFGSRKSIYQYRQEVRFNYLDTMLYQVSGTVFKDINMDCSLQPGEQLLGGWPVKAIGSTGAVYNNTTDEFGYYEFKTCPQDTSLEISLDVPFNSAGACPSVYVVSPGTTPVFQDIPAQLDTCSVMGVDLATPVLRRCFPGAYTVSYCNYSNALIENTYVEVDVDPAIEILSTSIPGVEQSAGAWHFETGDLAAGDCNSFQIFYKLDCNAPLGNTYCLTAEIFPQAVCAGAAPWAGSDLRVSAQCDGDSVRMKIQNIGTGNMNTALDFVVTEDLIMNMMQGFQLNSGGEKAVVVPANGSTWRLEAPQEPGHPWGGVEVAAMEGCGGVNTPGVITQFTVNSPNPFSTRNCEISVGSYDPNDKNAVPVGYGPEHFIPENTGIDYKIRFQNTGTASAVFVVVLDTLSPLLDASSIRAGASSHPYDFDILDGNVLRFRFDDIMLPDSNSNEPGSHGFVQFSIAQQKDNPLGSVINNSAAIYFDYNAPVITNETWHTIGDHFITVTAVSNPKDANPVNVYPNPTAEMAWFELPAGETGGQFTLQNGLGVTVEAAQFAANRYQFQRKSLPSGQYFYQIKTDAGKVWTGKVVLR